MEDPNEELLHWTLVMELAQTYLSAAGGSHDALAQASDGTKGGAHWKDIAAESFFSLSISPSRKQQFLGRSDRDPHDEVLLETLESLLLQQNTNTAKEIVGITFRDYITSVERGAIVSLGLGFLV